MMEDTEVPFGVRAKIAQDLLDRAGLIATQVHQIIPTTEDPVMRFFEDAFSDPKSRKPRSSSQKLSQPTTRPRIAEMIKAGAFDRKPGSDQ
jgi:hypothetical protein